MNEQDGIDGLLRHQNGKLGCAFARVDIKVDFFEYDPSVNKIFLVVEGNPTPQFMGWADNDFNDVLIQSKRVLVAHFPMQPDGAITREGAYEYWVPLVTKH